jgi:hypothetical protein
MLALEFNAKKPGCTWTLEKIRSLLPIKTTFLQRCGLRSAKTLLSTFNAELGPGSPEREHTISGSREMTKMLNLEEGKKNSALQKKRREKLKLKEECTQRREKTSTSFSMSLRLGD